MRDTTLIRATCSWCHHFNVIAAPRVYCPSCGHRADVARAYCDCPACTHGPPPITAADVEEARQFVAGLKPKQPT
jgi:hypothetical protein